MQNLNFRTSHTMRSIAFWLACLGALLAPAAALAQSGEQAADDDAQGLTQAQLTLDDLRTFTDVFNQIRRNYVEGAEDKKLLESAIRGMLSELDPHSSYISGEAYRDIRDSSEGQYEGIGVDLEPRGGRIEVLSVIDDSPADRAGINPGDAIVAIDGEPLEGRDLDEAIDSLLGEAGTTVELDIVTPEDEERRVKVPRAVIEIPSMTFRQLDRAWGYFRIRVFNTESAHDLKSKLDSVRGEGTNLRGLVIDLRNNPGGVLQGAVEMADGFLDEGVIVTTRGRNSAMQMEFEAHPGQWLEDAPLILLVDRGTASASEVLAGALQDHGRAVIVGERTFGKGSVQSVLPLRNGNGIKLTTARYYTPSGRSIQAQGIRPDVLYEGGGAANPQRGRIREADLERHLDRDPEAGEDPAGTAEAQSPDYLEEALQVLEEADILVAARTPSDQPPGVGPP
jgi:carboxyl-terminal processing protease